jgi:hypothetical protein
VIRSSSRRSSALRRRKGCFWRRVIAVEKINGASMMADAVENGDTHAK